MLYFLRDDSNNLLGFTYQGDTYYYKKNAFDDIIGIYDSNYKEVCTYNYDSYGNILSIKDSTGKDITDTSNVALINPFRYRSYYYDTETNLYYLNSRYYSPKMGRFINCDDSIGDKGINITYNLYCYASNSPITNIDDDGNWPKWVGNVVKIAAGISVIAGCIIAVGVTGGASAGVAGFIADGALKGALAGAVIGAISSAASGAYKEIKQKSSTSEILSSAGQGAINGFSSGSISGAIIGASTNGLRTIRAASHWTKGYKGQSRLSQLSYHYEKHAINEGFSSRNNIVKYTKDALNFENRNSKLLNFTYNYKYNNTSWNFKYNNTSWNFKYINGSGGEFSKTGEIITFFYKFMK